MIKPLFSLLAVALTIASTPVFANEVGPNVTAAYTRCVNAAASEADQGNCLEGELARQKTNLNAAYAERTRGMDADDLALIQSAQKAWIAFREADCKAQMVKNGSAAGASWLTCMVRLTAARALELEDYGVW